MFREHALGRVAAGAALVAGTAARSAVRSGWRRVGGREPAIERREPQVDWGEAVPRAVVSGVAVGTTRLLVRRAVERRRNAAG